MHRRVARPSRTAPRGAPSPLTTRGLAWPADAERVDVAIYAAVATTPTPSLDRAMRRLSSAADRSKLNLAAALLLAVARGARGRDAAGRGLAAVATASTLVNLVVKPVARRRRPDQGLHGVPLHRRARMPATRSFPSGHTASAFAFATAVGETLPRDAVPLRLMAAVVGYSRLHTGVHYPGDVVLGAVLGTLSAQATSRALARRRGRRPHPVRMMPTAHAASTLATTNTSTERSTMATVEKETHDALKGISAGDVELLADAVDLREAQLEHTGLDSRTFGLVKIAALVALDAPPASYAWQVPNALADGATPSDVLGVLRAIAPQVGGPRIVAAAAELTLALGIDPLEG